MYSSNKTSASGMDKYVKGTARSLSPVYYKTAHGYTGGEIIYRKSDSTFDLAKADAGATAEVLGVVVQTEGTDRFALCLEGEISLVAGNFQEGTLTGLVDGSTLFLSGTTAGKFTWTEPNTVSYISKPIATVTSISGTIVKCVFNNFRGTTVGGTNLYTTIPLSNGTATTILNLSDDTMFPVGSCGELTGGECNILQTGVNTDYIFGWKLLWAKTASNVVNIQPDAMQDVPPGFAFGTSGANIQVSFTALANFESGKVRYAMNAAPVGAQLPLQIASSRITYSEPTMFRNRIINGNMGIWQRGTSGNALETNAGSYVAADRWKITGFSAGVGYAFANLAQVTTSLPTGYRYAAKLASTGAGNDGLYMVQYIESANTYDLVGQNITVTCRIKKLAGYNAASPIVVGLYRLNTLDISASDITAMTGATLLQSYSHTPATTDWEIVSFVTTSVLPVEAANGLALRLSYAKTDMGAADIFAITGVQLEPGTQATPFEFRPYSTELQLCQRYYYRTYPVRSGSWNNFPINCHSTESHLVISFPFPVTMRTQVIGVTSIVGDQYTGAVAPSSGNQWTTGNIGVGYIGGIGTMNASAGNTAASSEVMTLWLYGVTYSSPPNCLVLKDAHYLEASAEL